MYRKIPESAAKQLEKEGNLFKLKFIVNTHISTFWGNVTFLDTVTQKKVYNVSGELKGSYWCTHHNDVAWSVLDGPKETEYYNNYMEEVSKNGSPLVTKEIKDLSFQSKHL